MTLGTVISCDLDILAQLPPYAKVRFKAVNMAQALAARHTSNQRLRQVKDFLLGKEENGQER